MPDGSVEVLACGTGEALTALENWLQEGPPLASVTRLESHAVEVMEAASFRIG